MAFLRCVCAILASLTAVPAFGCTPLEPQQLFGFTRAHVTHLPKNALGVMFFMGSRNPRAEDFRLTSPQDQRNLSLRVHVLKGSAWVRIEPVPGFQPGAHYLFRYLPAHGPWIYPDVLDVAIDDATAETRGTYEFALAPRPRHRVIIVPTISGSCVEPAPAVVQEFTYAIPAGLAPYADALDYGAHIAAVVPPAKTLPYIPMWPNAPELYDDGAYSMGQGFAKPYDARKNAVVAACGPRWPGMRLSGEVMFPEVDLVRHRLPSVDVDLGENIGEQCDELDALLNTVDWRQPESSLRAVCGSFLATSIVAPGQPMRNTELGAWARALANSYGFSRTCNLVALAYLWHTGQYGTQPAVLHRFGTVVDRSLGYAEAVERRAAWHALAYLVEQLPPQARPAMARQLLAPLKEKLVDALAAPHPAWPQDLASLIARAGNLTLAQRRKLQAVAAGPSPGAVAARSVIGMQK